jgi:lantibiotic modifying enzyme
MIEKKKKIGEMLAESRAGEEQNVGLLSGTGGKVLLWHEAYLQGLTSDMEIENLLYNISEQLQNKSFVFSYCQGLAGVGWLFEYLSTRDYLNIDTRILLQDFDSPLEKVLSNAMKENHDDLLHGGLGIVLYFLKRIGKKNTWSSLIENFVVHLQSTATPLVYPRVGWLTPVSLSEPRLAFNFSLSHGMSGILLVLCKICQNCDSKAIFKSILPLIQGIVYFMFEHEATRANKLSFFPSVVFPEEEPSLHSRLAWCYGDLGVATALYYAGQTLSRQDWIDKALEIFVFAAEKRRDLKENGIIDAGLCHGSAGVGHIFYRMWWNTKMPEFKRAADYWFDITLKMADFHDGLAGYKSFRAHGYENDYSLLTGIHGIALALLTHYYEACPAWDECLLLS